MSHLLIVFVAGYFSTFLLGFQSRNVNYGHYVWAAATSFSIALSSTFLWSTILKDLTLVSAVVYGFSGATGITSSMYVHKRWINKEPKR